MFLVYIIQSTCFGIFCSEFAVNFQTSNSEIRMQQSLLALGLPSFDTVLNNYRFSYSCLENEYCNPIIVQIKEFH